MFVSGMGGMGGLSGKAGMLKQFKTLFKNPKLMFRAMRMKGGFVTKMFGKLGLGSTKLTSSFSKAGTLFTKGVSGVVSKLPSIVSKTGLSTISKVLPSISKAGPLLAKSLKVLGPVGAVADVVMGGVSGYNSSEMSAEEQKAAGVKEGIGGVEATVLGSLTGGAKKGSMFSETLGIEKGGAGDEALGIAMAAGRGALIGAMFGPIGAAVGGAVGGIAESFKVFTNPDSALRKGVVDGVSALGSGLADAGKAVWDTGKTLVTGYVDIQKKIGSTIAEGAKSAYNSISNTASGAWDYASSFFANGSPSVEGGFRAFANGGMVSKPTLGLVGEGRMNEAVIPLPDGKTVPVSLTGGGGSSEIVTLLKELISEVRNGGDVYMDGALVGRSMMMATSNLG
jgi:hypothetical protein